METNFYGPLHCSDLINFWSHPGDPASHRFTMQLAKKEAKQNETKTEKAFTYIDIQILSFCS